MVKKHKTTYPSFTNYVHPSLVSSKSSASDSPPSALTVNEKLQNLRLASPSADAIQRQRDIAQSSSQRPVPPNLHRILGVPDIAPPPPPPGVRVRTRNRIPGPAAPPSWQSKYKSRRKEPVEDYSSSDDSDEAHTPHGRNGGRPKAGRLNAFLRESEQRIIDPRSLAHATLRNTASVWEHVDDDGLYYLATAPAYLRTALVSYLSHQGPPTGITTHQLKTLLDSSEDVSCLDLTSLIGWTLSLRDLNRILHRPEDRSSSTRNPSSEPAESWDEEDAPPSIDRMTLSIPRQLSVNVPLTALSLGRPPPNISWTDLLHLTANLPTLTHLSLSAWPWPTKTPHLAGTTYTARDDNDVPASGSSYYAELDGDLLEARQLLRQLSRHTYCLQYLDISRCRWTAALVPSLPVPATPPTRQTSNHFSPSDPSSPTQTATGPDWPGAWKSLTRLRINQSLPPTKLDWLYPSQPPLRSTPRNAADPLSVRADVLRYLHAAHPQTQHSGENIWRRSGKVGRCHACGLMAGDGAGTCRACDIRLEQSLKREREWVEREVGLRVVAAGVRRARRGGEVLVVEYGWMEG